MAVRVARSRAIAGATLNLSPATARVLIATDSVSDANQLQRSLEDHFKLFRKSTNPALAIEDFEDFMPDVVVLAFDCIDKAQRYSLGLSRLSGAVQQQAHRSILLCAKSELSRAFELCKKRDYDDYVLYWPVAYEGLRLPMSIWIACRELLAVRANCAPRAELPAAAETVVTRPLIMVVEDDELARDLLGRALDSQLYEVVFAADSENALNEMRHVRPDAILMDVRLPGLDGVSFTRYLKTAPNLATVPIVMLTGDGRRTTLVSSIEAGAADFLVKPYTREALNAKLRKVLRSSGYPDNGKRPAAPLQIRS
jgi:CheY-like chemotaxis protein